MTGFMTTGLIWVRYAHSSTKSITTNYSRVMVHMYTSVDGLCVHLL